jgi:DMSO/TMAO reductase YedYZ molybdopterin-dependent catalytic subunit
MPVMVPATEMNRLGRALQPRYALSEEAHSMNESNEQDLSRRALLKGGGAALAGLSGLSVLQVAGPAHAFPGSSDEDVDVLWDHEKPPLRDDYPGQPGDEVIWWTDQPAPFPFPGPPPVQLVWEELDTRWIPNDEFHVVSHYGEPELREQDWRLDIDGLVRHPRTLSLANVKARPRREVEFTLECSGNTGLPFAIGFVGNARWAGAELASLLREADVLDDATEVVFWGADSGTVTVRDNSGITSAGETGTGTPDENGGLDLTFTEQFARSMSVKDALRRVNLLCYEMNGDALPVAHGFPLRLIAPGWYGVANVKWLTRIQVIDRRYQGRFMARDYVTIRELGLDTNEVVWTATSVGSARLKSAPAKVTRRDGRYTIIGVAWGAPIQRVEVKIDDGPWTAAALVGKQPRSGSRGYAWRFWTSDWGTPAEGEHTIASRAIDVEGNVQPSPDDEVVAARRTFWENNGQITRHITIDHQA